mgnify:CR=1 FL=1
MENFVYCNEEEIRDYLRAFGEGRDSRDTELSEGVRLMRFYELQLKKKYLVGIPLTPEGFRQMKSGAITKSEAIKKFRKDDTDVDILIIDADDSSATHRDTFNGDVFQMKRLTENQFDGGLISPVIAALEKILGMKYQKSTYLSLYIPINLETATEKPEWNLITDFLAAREVPFVRVILGPIKNEHGQDLLVEVFPNLRFLTA